MYIAIEIMNMTVLSYVCAMYDKEVKEEEMQVNQSFTSLVFLGELASLLSPEPGVSSLSSLRQVIGGNASLGSEKMLPVQSL